MVRLFVLLRDALFRTHATSSCPSGTLSMCNVLAYWNHTRSLATTRNRGLSRVVPHPVWSTTEAVGSSVKNLRKRLFGKVICVAHTVFFCSAHRSHYY